MIAREAVTGVVLAGGLSTRFGSNKAMAVWNAETLLQRALNLLQPCCRTVLISGEYPEYTGLSYPKLPDETSGLGPLGGIRTALKHAGTPHMLFLSCDMPLMERKVIGRLLAEAAPADDLVLWKQMDESLQMFPVLVAKSFLPVVEKHIADRLLSLKALLPAARCRFLPVTEAEERLFANVNRKDDLEKLIKYE